MKCCVSQASSIHLTSLFTFASTVSEVHAILYSWTKIDFFGTMTSVVLVLYYHMNEIHLWILSSAFQLEIEVRTSCETVQGPLEVGQQRQLVSLMI
jgi:hypothetical protein